MIGLIVPVILGVIVWKLWRPGQQFASGFASLLERPPGRNGLWPFLTGVERIGGHYQDRPVLLILHHKRRGHTPGYLIVAMQPFGASEIGTKYSGVFREWIREPAAREAGDDLELHLELKLSFGEGWMRATWQPSGFVFFPGRFELERWRRVLRSMHMVVVSQERGASVVPPS